MKSIIFFIALLLLQSCIDVESLEPIAEPKTDECTVGSFNYHNINVTFEKITDLDTIWFTYIHIDGSTNTGYWNEGVTDWSCVGFTMYDEPYTVTVMTSSDTCILIVPGLIGNE